MGSFDFTCCVSGLPIGYGDPVRFLLLTENPYHGPSEHTCYIHDRWMPRTFPLCAKYNDYGSVENIELGPAHDIWLDAFKQDLVERGTGDNSCHDVPVRKDMTLTTGLLEALWEGRLLVTRSGSRDLNPDELRKLRKEARKRGDDPGLHPGVPTIKRIRAILSGGKLKLSDGDFAKGYLVDLQRSGFVRVRWGEFGVPTAHLKAAQDLLSDRFATMVTTGTGNYSGTAELIVAPKPLTGNERYNKAFGGNHGRKKHLHVAQAMIREDVWQALCAQEFKHWNKTIPTTVDGYRKLARTMWEDYLRIETIEDPREKLLSKLSRESGGRDNIVAALTKNEAAAGLMTHFDLMLARKPEGKNLESFLDTVGEMAFIQCVLADTRYQWRPASSAGPQGGEWKRHHSLLRAYVGICDQVLAEDEGDADLAPQARTARAPLADRRAR